MICHQQEIHFTDRYTQHGKVEKCKKYSTWMGIKESRCSYIHLKKNSYRIKIEDTRLLSNGQRIDSIKTYKDYKCTYIFRKAYNFILKQNRYKGDKLQDIAGHLTILIPHYHQWKAHPDKKKLITNSSALNHSIEQMDLTGRKFHLIITNHKMRALLS